MNECPECGAPDQACGARFDELLALEFTDGNYGAVHHLTVTAFMLQHSSRLTREGWLYERDLLRRFLVEKVPPEIIRKQVRDQVDNGKRNFTIKSHNGKPVIRKTTWTSTILDVRMDNATKYCQDVAQWARSVLEDVYEIEPE